MFLGKECLAGNVRNPRSISC